jgi:hypothetical protein
MPSSDYFTIFLNFMSKEYNTCCPAAHGLVWITVMHIQKLYYGPIQGLLRRMTDFLYTGVPKITRVVVPLPFEA